MLLYILLLEYLATPATAYAQIARPSWRGRRQQACVQGSVCKLMLICPLTPSLGYKIVNPTIDLR